LFARPQITLEEAESLLPAKPDRDLWSDADEAWLQSTWTARDDELLDMQTARNTREPPLWKTMLHLFGQHPYMLFRYGLKHDGRRHELRLNGEKVFTPYLPQTTCVDLRKLLCHPIWEGDIAVLRFALQTAVAYRVPGHIRPIAAMRFSEEDEARLACTQVGEQRGALASELYNSGPHNRTAVNRLCEALEQVVEKDRDEGDGAGRLTREQQLFLLRSNDVAAVVRALDGLKANGRPVYKQCKKYLEDYKATLVGRQHVVQHPTDLETLKRWKKWFYVGTKRDWVVSKRQKDAGAVRLDVDANDGYPHHFEHAASIAMTRHHRAVLSGAIWPISTEEMPEYPGKNEPVPASRNARDGAPRAVGKPGEKGRDIGGREPSRRANNSSATETQDPQDDVRRTTGERGQEGPERGNGGDNAEVHDEGFVPAADEPCDETQAGEGGDADTSGEGQTAATGKDVDEDGEAEDGASTNVETNDDVGSSAEPTAQNSRESRLEHEGGHSSETRLIVFGKPEKHADGKQATDSPGRERDGQGHDVGRPKGSAVGQTGLISPQKSQPPIIPGGEEAKLCITAFTHMPPMVGREEDVARPRRLRARVVLQPVRSVDVYHETDPRIWHLPWEDADTA
jgi:hypothetical protein